MQVSIKWIPLPKQMAAEVLSPRLSFLYRYSHSLAYVSLHRNSLAFAKAQALSIGESRKQPLSPGTSLVVLKDIEKFVMAAVTVLWFFCICHHRQCISVHLQNPLNSNKSSVLALPPSSEASFCIISLTPSPCESSTNCCFWSGRVSSSTTCFAGLHLQPHHPWGRTSTSLHLGGWSRLHLSSSLIAGVVATIFRV